MVIADIVFLLCFSSAPIILLQIPMEIRTPCNKSWRVRFSYTFFKKAIIKIPYVSTLFKKKSYARAFFRICFICLFYALLFCIPKK